MKQVNILLIMLFSAIAPGCVSQNTGVDIQNDAKIFCRKIASIKLEQANAYSKETGTPIPSLFTDYLAEMQKGDFLEAGNVYAIIHPLVYKHKFSSKEYRAPSWQYVLECYGAQEKFMFNGAKDCAEYAAEIFKNMPDGSVYFGGTDPGRFVPTAVYDYNNKPNIAIITQNALADSTYLEYIQYRFGSMMRIPSTTDAVRITNKYIDKVRRENGRLTVDDVQVVMEANGAIAKSIFEMNRKDHPFFVEESYVIPWMYPYLRPHGLIMKLEENALPEPASDLPFWNRLIAQDKNYWDKICSSSWMEKNFNTEQSLRSAISKMRSAIGGLYVFRNFTNEAEYAFNQALLLYPHSPEAYFRLADLHMQQYRYDEAIKRIEQYIAIWPDNNNARSFLQKIRDLQKYNHRRQELEDQISANKGANIDILLELVDIYKFMNIDAKFRGLTTAIFASSSLTPVGCQKVIKLCTDAGKWDLAESGLKRLLNLEPKNYCALIELAYAQLMERNSLDWYTSLQKAVEIGGDDARLVLNQDKRFLRYQGLPVFSQNSSGVLAK